MVTSKLGQIPPPSFKHGILSFASVMTSTFSGTNEGLQVGINNGSIQYHPPAAPVPVQPEPRPEPLSTVPFPRDQDFVSRDALLEQIHEKASIPGSRIVLVGLGGVGKTQLAIEYCYQVRAQSPDTWVFWVHASSTARCEKSLWDLADRAQIPGRQNRNANIFQLVANWLRDEKIGKWILVLDNVDDHELLRQHLATRTESQAKGPTFTQPPLRHLLEITDGTIIVTSRNTAAALDITSHKNLIEVQPMLKAEALNLLQKKLNMPTTTDSTTRLVEVLEFMPLAIVQAAAYISNCSPRCSVAQYLEEFQNSERAMTLLNYEIGHGHVNRDWSANNSILVTWQISFDYVQRTQKSAADLLSLMSFFDRQGIPEYLLRSYQTAQNWRSRLRHKYRVALNRWDKYQTSHQDWLTAVPDNPHSKRTSADTTFTDDIFDEDIGILRQHSFISVDQDPTVFRMHRLVQLATLRWLRIQRRMEYWKGFFIESIYKAFPMDQDENWETCGSLFPHVKSALAQAPKVRYRLHEWAMLLWEGAWYALKYGSLSDAEGMASKSRDARTKLFGAWHLYTHSSTSILAIVYSEQGRWQDAEPLHSQVIRFQKLVKGSKHPDTLWSMASLARAYGIQGRCKEAEKLHMQVMEARKTNLKLGENHPDMLWSMENLAWTYRIQGRWEEAEKLYMQVMETYKTTLSEDHPDTLRSMRSLAQIYLRQPEGRLEEAERLFMQVLGTYASGKTKLGADHPDTLQAMSGLAETYLSQDRCKEAEKLHMQVMEARKTKLGEDHPDTLISMGNLAGTYWCQGRWEEAEKLHIQVTETRKTKLSEDHPDTLQSMGSLAGRYLSLGRWKEAEKLYMQVMETRKTKLGVDHPDTIQSMGSLARAYEIQGRWEEAERLFVRVLATHKTKLGEDHPNTLWSMGSLAATYSSQGRWEEAEKLHIQVMETRKTKLGKEHPDTLTSIANLAWTYGMQGWWEEAEKLQKQVMETRKTKLGEDHPDTLSIMANLAETYLHLSQGRWEEAEKLHIQVMETRKTNFGVDHPDTLRSMGSLARVYLRQGRLEEAERLFVRVLAAHKTKLGEDHPDTLTSMHNLAFTLKDAGRHSEAISLLRICVSKQQRTLGPAHPHTMFTSDALLAWETEDVTIEA